WSISRYGAINSPSTNQSVTVDAGAAVSFSLLLVISNVNGCTSSCDKPVTVNPNPVCSISGESAVCASTTSHTYTGPASTSSYAWFISGSGAINGPSTNQSVTVDAGVADSFTLRLLITGANGCA